MVSVPQSSTSLKTSVHPHPTHSHTCTRLRRSANRGRLQVTELFSGYVGAMLAEYAASPAAHWKSKDCAVYLVTALTVRGKTAAAGATATNTLVHLLDFFGQHIAPELQSPAVNERPVLKADALKFLTTFRGQLPKEAVLALFPLLVRWGSGECRAIGGGGDIWCSEGGGRGEAQQTVVAPAFAS